MSDRRASNNRPLHRGRALRPSGEVGTTEMPHSRDRGRRVHPETRVGSDGYNGNTCWFHPAPGPSRVASRRPSSPRSSGSSPPATCSYPFEAARVTTSEEMGPAGQEQTIRECLAQRGVRGSTPVGQAVHRTGQSLTAPLQPERLAAFKPGSATHGGWSSRYPRDAHITFWRVRK